MNHHRHRSSSAFRLQAEATFLACALAIASSSSVTGWGLDGHQLIARMAVKNLPADMPSFFTKAVKQLEFLNSEPDAWRDPKEAELGPALAFGHDPDHIFKFELYAPDSLPPDRYSYIEALRQLGKVPPPVGMLPYRSVELFQRLRVSWRRWRVTTDQEVRGFLEQRIVDDVGILGHYIADSSQPLHMSVNRNGWELPQNPRNYTRDNTLHRRFEGEFVKARVTEEDVQLSIRAVKVVPEPLSEIYAHMRRAFDQVVTLYELEKTTPFGPDNTSPQARRFAAERLADAVSTLRDLWYTAYRTSN